jgi:hypothetical protein
VRTQARQSCSCGQAPHNASTCSARRSAGGTNWISGRIAGTTYILWHIDPLLGNDRETNNNTMTVARQRPARNNGGTVGSGVFCFLCGPLRDYMTLPTEFSSFNAVQCSGVEWSELVDE